MRRRSRGFTLLEGLFSILMVSMILGALTQTLSQAARVKSNTKNMDQTVEQFHALSSMKNDAVAATVISRPAVGSSSSTLELRRINPELNFQQRIDPTSDPLNPFEPTEEIAVEYRLDGGVLKRYRNVDGQPPTAERLLVVESLELQREGSEPGLLTLSIRVAGERVTKTRMLKVLVTAR